MNDSSSSGVLDMAKGANGSLSGPLRVFGLASITIFAGLIVGANYQSFADSAMILSIGGMILLSGNMLFSATRIVSPLKELSDYAVRLSEGRAVEAGTLARRDDEIGRIARLLKTGFEQKVYSEDSRAKEAKERELAAIAIAEQDAARIKQEEATANAVEEISLSLKKMAGGNLTCKITNSFDGKLEDLRINLNATIDQYAATIRKIKASTDSLNSGIREIVSASDDLSVRTERQASSLEETAATVGQITETVEKSAQGADETSKIVEGAKEEAQCSGEVVERALTAMREIEESANEINQIISVIDEIAFQTNLLALNAGVEAARAGEAGQGFAVVASEVRALAQRSATAAKEIKQLISKSSEQVSGGSKLVVETGDTLHRIADQVLKISSVIGEIANGAKEQHSSLNELNIAVGDLDSSTQQNAAMAEEATAACHSLRTEASELIRLTGTFDTGDDNEAARTGSNAKGFSLMSVKPAASVAKPEAVSNISAANNSGKPAPSPAKELMSRIEGAFNANSDSNAASQPGKKNFLGNAVIENDNWEEF